MLQAKEVLLRGIIVFGFILPSCNQTTEKTELNSDPLEISIDPDNSNTTSFFEIWDRVELIPLETTGESLIKSFDKLIIYNNDYYILDSEQSCILCFDTNGMYQRRIGKKGQGPGEYTSIADFQINEHHNTIELLSPLGQVYVYSIDGAFQSVTDVGDQLRSAHFFSNITSDLTAFYSLFEQQKIAWYSRSTERIIKKQYTIPEYLVRTPIVNPDQSPFFKNDNLRLFTSSHTSQIFRIEGDSLLLHRMIDFEDANFDFNNLTGDMDPETITLSLLQSSDCHSLRNYIENESFIFFRYMYKRKWYTAIVSTADTRYWIIHKFSESVMLPNNFVFTDEGICGMIDPLRISILVNRKVLSPEMHEIMTSTSIDSNPMIVRYYFNDVIGKGPGYSYNYP